MESEKLDDLKEWLDENFLVAAEHQYNDAGSWIVYMTTFDEEENPSYIQLSGWYSSYEGFSVDNAEFVEPFLVLETKYRLCRK